MNSVFAQYEELSSPQFAVINLSLRLRLITANFGLDNSSYSAQVITQTNNVAHVFLLEMHRIRSWYIVMHTHPGTRV